ncbi:TIM-barrel domain-containing protein [Schleiferilactobacillus shenzhenensis]|uniref:Putative alpha-glucosidase n=1 Tax=Schleiferilactobacillus shenzhenensis LY-73 TaxID=1231336 RepID=U4TU67_9LACO|nr:TIM-barrel domain-containing protein [Schleiferilactobacillus shenzhenensis]ERL64982.1 putative alpha-glucosidase [Schleiferilactobacillus shenzhenensis LY-73]
MVQDPQAIQQETYHDGVLTVATSHLHGRLSWVNDHILRVQVSQTDQFPTHPTVPAAVAVDKNNDQTVATGGSGQTAETPIVIEHDQYTLTTADPYQADWRKADGSLVISGPHGPITTLRMPTWEYDEQGWLARFSFSPDEYFFGGGTQNGRSALRGQRVTIANTNVWTAGGVASPVPFFWSTAGYGVLVNTFTPGHYDFSTPARGVMISHEDPVMDLYIILAPDPARLIHGYHELTGKPLLAPRFSFYPAHLNAYNRDYWLPVTKESVGAILFPDNQWYKEYQPISEKTFNTGYRAGTITVNGQKLVPNNGAAPVHFTEHDADGNPSGAVHESLNGEGASAQFSARAVLDRYLQNQLPIGWFLPNDGYGAGYGQTDSLAGDLANLHRFTAYANDAGVAVGLWTQEKLHPDDPEHPQKGERDIEKEVGTAGVAAVKTDVAWVGEGYTFGLHATADAAAAMTKYGQGRRPFIMSLDGWAGSQRYTSIWSGDQGGDDWENIRSHIATYLSTGLSGNPNVGSDIDGIYGGSDPLIQTRDLQWKSFTPIQLNMDGWGTQPKNMGLVFGKPYVDINRAYLQFKTTLMPYLYTLAHTARETGAPIVRPLFWAEPDAYTYGSDTDTEFLLGDDLLIAPVTGPYRLQKDGSAQVPHLYLPDPHSSWTDIFTGRRYNGGQTLADYPAPLAQTPIFVRTGALLPRVPVHLTPGTYPHDTRILTYFPGPQPSETAVYSDDGATLAYQDGQSATTRIRATDDGRRMIITVGATQGTYTGQDQNPAFILQVATNARPHTVQVTAGGRPTKLREALQPNPTGANWALGELSEWPLAAIAPRTGITVTLPNQAITTEQTIIIDY